MQVKKTVKTTQKTATVANVEADINKAFELNKISEDERKEYIAKYNSLNEEEIRKVYGRELVRGDLVTLLVNSHFQYRIRLRFVNVTPIRAAEDLLDEVGNKLKDLPIDKKVKLSLGASTSVVVKKVDERTVELISIYY